MTVAEEGRVAKLAREERYPADREADWDIFKLVIKD
jgi:hypothetical protein